MAVAILLLQPKRCFCRAHLVRSDLIVITLSLHEKNSSSMSSRKITLTPKSLAFLKTLEWLYFVLALPSIFASRDDGSMKSSFVVNFFFLSSSKHLREVIK